MIRDYVKQINDILEKITKEDKENTDNLVKYVTSTEVNVGGMLCRYGELYKLVFYSRDYDDIIQKLEHLYYLERFEGYEDTIKNIQDIFVEGLKKDRNFDLGTRRDVLDKLEHEYIFDVILGCL